MSAAEAGEHMKRAVERLQTLKHDGIKMPSAEETVIAALNVAENLYTLALGSLALEPNDDAERSNLQKSHARFRAYFEDSSQLTALGEALLELPQSSQSPRLTKTAHALRTVVTFVCVRQARGHTDREAFQEALHCILPEFMQQEGRFARSAESARSSIFLCFNKLLGDVPGAIKSNASRYKPRRRKPQKSTPRTVSDTDEPRTVETNPVRLWGVSDPHCCLRHAAP